MSIAADRAIALLRLCALVELGQGLDTVKVCRAAEYANLVRNRQVRQYERRIIRIALPRGAVAAIAKIVVVVRIVHSDRELVHAAGEHRAVHAAGIRAEGAELEIDAVGNVVANARVDVLVAGDLHPAVDEPDVGGGEGAHDAARGDAGGVERGRSAGGGQRAGVLDALDGRPCGEFRAMIHAVPNEVEVRGVVERVRRHGDDDAVAVDGERQRGRRDG